MYRKPLGILVQIAIVLSMTVCFTFSTSVLASTPHYGSIQRKGQSVVQVNHPRPVTVFHLSDARAKQLALRFGGRKAFAHMLHRVTKPLSTQVHVSYATSGNWAGYVSDTSSTGNTVNSSSADFNVSSTSGTDTATWVGIGGYNGGNLAQTGVDDTQRASWYEFYPNPPVFLYYVNPGDSMYGTVSLDSDTGNWYVDIQDFTTNQYYANEFSFNPDQTTADWIVEVQQNGPVPNFSSANFSQAVWGDQNNSNLPLTSSDGNPTSVTLQSPVGGTVCPSGVGSDGESFSVAPC